MRHSLILAILLAAMTTLAASCALAADAEQDVLVVEDAWVREGPPGMGMMAGFMTLRNDGEQPRTISAVRSPAFGSIEMHETVISDGVARMVAVEALEVPAKGSVELAPGGKHLMLFQPVRPLSAGDEVVFYLDTGGDDCVRVSAEVRRGQKN